ncbi:uncharacterized protein BT62DRAFT_937313 [Guyanagaster necrorhizus]|uniref:Ser-Thr-rich glycosyl-phosphatidyl-inositol-anchored membrane family-domain-containing protein n=1 Tax=Guyanagaster necrorhizus TaxID=856835 RepID=A0A9P7VIE9_9AGAR|nr:uncharacterized protein BT62DRAFT_937313 [Guyanagaster necrorhizus MCA 3950]KAG7441279.1 hypothetical protein BT62DRAFT_937313 [Guyanagaster necrorhizus MCA 3950]
MRLLNLLPIPLVATVASAYFEITSPSENAQWRNGGVNVISWEKGTLDGIDSFDIEMTRLSEDGLTYIASTVPAEKASPSSLNVYLENIPAADDYFLLFLNATHGIMYTTSPRFTILNSSATSTSGSTPTPDRAVATVTISGTPNPTQGFVTTFAAASSALPNLEWRALVGIGAVLVAGLGGAVCVLV